jgi:hypothetical protein
MANLFGPGRSIYNPTSEIDTEDPENSIYMGPNPDLHRAMRRKAVESELGNEAQTDPNQGEEMGEDPRVLSGKLGQEGNANVPWKGAAWDRAVAQDDMNAANRRHKAVIDLTDKTQAPYKWQGGANFAQQIDPKIRKQIVDEIMGDQTLAPKQITGSFGGRDFVMNPSRTINQNAANQINARQMRQMEIDRQLASDERRQKNLLEVAALPGKQAIDLETARHNNTVSDWQLQHPQALRDAETNKAVAEAGISQANLEDTRRDPLTGLTAKEKRENNLSATKSTIEGLMKIGTPEALAKAAQLRSGLPGFTPEMAAATAIQAPTSAVDPATLRSRLQGNAATFAQKDTSWKIGDDPTETDMQSMIGQRNAFAKALLAQNPQLTPQQAAEEANATIEEKLLPNAGSWNAGWIEDLRKRMAAEGLPAERQSYGSQAVNLANPLLPRSRGFSRVGTVD